MDLLRYIQTAFGYALTGETREQVLFILYGTGSNGKSTLLECISNVVGTFLFHLPIEVLISSNDGRGGAKASPELVAAANARILISSESNDGDRLNEGRIKQLTGGSTISIRQLYGESFEITPHFKIFLDSNHLPRISGRDFAIWRRIKIIPFNATFSENQVDKHLLEKLSQPSEKQAILAWLIQGATYYYTNGLVEPKIITESCNSYRFSEDSLGQFLSSCTEHGDSCKASVLYTAYEDFCKSSGHTPITQSAFGRDLSCNGYEKKRCSSGYVYYGIHIKTN